MAKKQQYVLEDPRVPNRRKSTHGRGGGEEPSVRSRHPEYRVHQPPAPQQEVAILDLQGSPATDVDKNCLPYADTFCYPIDVFSRVLAAPAYEPAGDGGAWGTITDKRGVQGQHHETLETSPFSYINPSPIDFRVESYVGSWYIPWPWRPDWSTCTFLDNTFSGWKEREVWYEAVVPAHPADVAGVTFGPISLSGASGVGGQGVYVHVASEEPTDLRAGVAVAYIPYGGSHTVFIPAASIPVEGETIYVGLVPAWNANRGAHVCGWVWPFDSGAENSGRVTFSTTETFTWQEWSVSDADWGAAISDDETGAWWEGRLPWSASGSGWNNTEIDGTSLKLTADENMSFLLRMAGASTFMPPDDDTDEQYGEPWTSEAGIRIAARFRITENGSVTEAGTRQFYVEFADSRDVYRVTAHLGDTERAEGISITGDEQVAYTAKAITEGFWMWLVIDTRHPDYIRGKMWVEQDVIGSGEPPAFDVSIERSNDAEAPISQDYLELGLFAGNETGDDQVIEVQRIIACGGTLVDCQWVTEKIGEGDGLTTVFTASMPLKAPTLHFEVDGFSVRPSVIDARAGTFTARQVWPAAERATLIARYAYDGALVDEDEEE